MIINDITIINGVTEHYLGTATEPYLTEIHEYYIPFFGLIFLTSVFLFIIYLINNRVK